MSEAPSIWFQTPVLSQAAELADGNLIGHLGIEIVAIGSDWLRGRMPVDERTRQPFGVLHGGASVVLAETLASLASSYVVDPKRNYCVGLEVNANHLRPVADGSVHGEVRPLQLGRRIHVWDVRIEDDRQRPVCVSRVTMAVVEGSLG